MRRGSWPALLGLSAAFLVAFWLVRGGSDFLAIEREAAAARAVATTTGLTTAEAMALRELLGVACGEDRWRAAATTFATERRRVGDAFAAVIVAGDAAAARAATAAAADAEAAWRAFRLRDEALPGLRFLAMRERFASRAAARD